MSIAIALCPPTNGHTYGIPQTMTLQSNIISADEIAQRFPNAKRSGDGWKIPCPQHKGDDANCYIANGDDGGLVAFCHSHPECTWQGIMDALGLPAKGQGRFYVATYQHPDGKNRHVYRRKTAKGKNIWGKGSVAGCQLLAWGQDDPDACLVLVEGEKAARSLQTLSLTGYTPVSWRGGAGSVDKADFSLCKGRHVICWPDADQEGKTAMQTAALKSKKAGATAVYLVSVDTLPEKADAADVDAETAENLLQAADWYEPHPEQDNDYGPPRDPETGEPLGWGGARDEAGRPETDDPADKTLRNRKALLRIEMINWAHDGQFPVYLHFDDPVNNDIARILEYCTDDLLAVDGRMHVAHGSVWRLLNQRDGESIHALRKLVQKARTTAIGALPDETPDVFAPLIDGVTTARWHLFQIAGTLETHLDAVERIPTAFFNDRNRHPVVPFSDGTAYHLGQDRLMSSTEALRLHLRDCGWQIPPPVESDLPEQAWGILLRQYGQPLIDRLAIYWCGIDKAADVLRMPSNAGKTSLFDMLGRSFPGAWSKENAAQVVNSSRERFTPLVKQLVSCVGVFLDEATHSDAAIKAHVLNSWDSETLEMEEKFEARGHVRRIGNLLIMGAEEWPHIDASAQGFSSRFKWVSDRGGIDKMTLEERNLILSDDAVAWFRHYLLARAAALLKEHGYVGAARQAQEDTPEVKGDVLTMTETRTNPVIRALRDLYAKTNLNGVSVTVESVMEELKKHEDLDAKDMPAKNRLTKLMGDALSIRGLVATKTKQADGTRPRSYVGVSKRSQ